MKKKTILMAVMALATASFIGCKPDEEIPQLPEELAEETYAGGRLGTTFNQSASAFEDPTPAVEQAGMVNAFKYGEFFFEHTVTQNNPPFNGLGPLYVRSSCEACHPGYGHGRRMERYRADDWANGYLLVVYNKTTDAYETSVAGMPQTKAVAPFKPSIDEEKININWLSYTDEWGNRFPDGETYNLIYPEVTIPEDAFYAPLSVPYSQLAFRLESTIGIYGTGLLDAIPDDSLKAQYQKEYDAGADLNPAIWAGHDWASLYGNTNHPKRFTYALSRGPLQDAAGANAIWNITNVNRSDRRSHYLSLNKSIYATTASEDPEVQAQFYHYFPQWNKTGDPRTDIYNYLMCDTLPIEMSDQDYVNFMVWHRGLAVPAARNLADTTVQRGRKLFRDMGCATCHRPSWKTGPDIYTDPTASLPTVTHACPATLTRLFGLIPTWCNTVCTWSTTSAPVGAVPHRCGVEACRPSVAAIATVYTTVVPEMWWRLSCGMDAPIVMPVGQWRNSASCQRVTATQWSSLLMLFNQ